jgi:hypothetical protein
VRGQVATYALAGLAFFLLCEHKRVGDSALSRLDGGLAEEAVVASLTSLAAEGWWRIENNRLRDDGFGDVDVIASDPSGRVFAIETKSRPLRRRDLRQALGNAAWLKGRLGVRWVNAVVCVPGDTAGSRDGKAWVVGQEQLVDRLRNAPV